ncbi:MAG: SsrA-binding protein SmpB [Candidatus Dojkabacteria bacterium]|jgi:SsrA-binding protein|nr:SsrA-binding protein SmpB [Candidatus Dojkabacteria bacterium]
MRIINKKALYNYEILERFETGIVLTGSEVKAIKDSRCNIGDAFVKIISNELWVVNMDIPKYKYDGSSDYDSARSRKLLVKKKELTYLESKMKQGNLTLVPLSVYSKGRNIKVEVGLARGKKRYEKKQQEKERDLDRELLLEKRKYMI